MIDEVAFGKLIANMENIVGDVAEIKTDIKTMLTAQATTEERLKNGNKRFEKYDDTFIEIENRFGKVWCALRKRADWRIAYPLIVSIGVVIVFLIDHYYSKAGN